MYNVAFLRNINVCNAVLMLRFYGVFIFSVFTMLQYFAVSEVPHWTSPFRFHLQCLLRGSVKRDRFANTVYMLSNTHWSTIPASVRACEHQLTDNNDIYTIGIFTLKQSPRGGGITEIKILCKHSGTSQPANT